MYRFRIIFFSLVLLSSGLVFSQESKKEVRLNAAKSFLAAPIWIADAKGYFVQEGLEVKIKTFGLGKACFLDMLDGNADISSVAQTPVMVNSFVRDDFKIIGSMVNSDNDVKILVREDRAIKEMKDLKGKKIALAKGSSSEFFLDIILLYAGVLKADVEIIDTKPYDLTEKFLSGDVDAICSWEPHIVKTLKKATFRTLVLPTSGIYREDFYFTSTKSFIESEPKKLLSFLKAIKRAQEFIRTERKAATNLLATSLDIENELVDSLWDIFQFDLTLDHSLLASIEDEARWGIKEGIVKEKEIPNYLNFIYTQALEKIDSDSVTIIK